MNTPDRRSAAGAARSGSGEPLVLIHGLGGSWRIWKPVLPALERRHDVLVVRLPGHLDSRAPTDQVEPTVDALVRAVEADMDAESLSDAHIVGNSLGGWMALELARRGRARSGVAIAPAGGWQAGDRNARRLERLLLLSYALACRMLPYADRIARTAVGRYLVLRQSRRWPSHVPYDDTADTLRAVAMCPTFPTLVKEMTRDGLATSGLSDLGVPALIALPTRDRILPPRRYAQRLMDAARGAESRPLPGLGHIPMSDDAQLVSRTILDFTGR